MHELDCITSSENVLNVFIRESLQGSMGTFAGDGVLNLQISGIDDVILI